MTNLVNPGGASGSMGVGVSAGSAMAGGAGGGVQRVVIDFTGADGAFKEFMRKIVRTDGRGSAEVAFGTGR